MSKQAEPKTRPPVFVVAPCLCGCNGTSTVALPSVVDALRLAVDLEAAGQVGRVVLQCPSKAQADAIAAECRAAIGRSLVSRLLKPVWN